MSHAVGLAAATAPWMWRTASAVALALLLLNVLLIVAVHGRRLRASVRRRRTKRFRARVETMFAELDPATRARDPEWLRNKIRRFDELERPIAATMLIERMKPASDEERRHMLEMLREAGAIDSLVRSTTRRIPWRRALAIRTLGWVGAADAVPLLIERLSDRNRHVREAAVRALGRIGDSRALPFLDALFRSPGRVGSGVVYDALVGFGADAQQVFAKGLRSPIASVRVASCFGVATASEPETAHGLLEAALDDDAGSVRGAAAESLRRVGGDRVPEGLARAVHDEHATVRSAATAALEAYDDPRAVELALEALLDTDRDTAVCAGEALVRLSRRPAAGNAATEALQRLETVWPVERALTFASLGVV
jgi:HEAT repeat protein